MSLISSYSKLQQCNRELYQTINDLEVNYNRRTIDLADLDVKFELKVNEYESTKEKCQQIDAQLALLTTDKNSNEFDSNRLYWEARKNILVFSQLLNSIEIERTKELIACTKECKNIYAAELRLFQELLPWINDPSCSDHEYVIRAQLIQQLYYNYIYPSDKELGFNGDGAEGTGLTSLPEAIGLLTKVEVIYLRGHQLSHFPEKFWQMTQLQTLILSKNSLKALPTQIKRLSQLEKLDVSQCQLESIPAELSQLTHLTDLNVMNNCLTEIPQSLIHLPSKCCFNVSNNPLPPETVEAFKRQVDPDHGPKVVS